MPPSVTPSSYPACLFLNTFQLCSPLNNALHVSSQRGPRIVTQRSGVDQCVHLTFGCRKRVITGTVLVVNGARRSLSSARHQGRTPNFEPWPHSLSPKHRAQRMPTGLKVGVVDASAS